ncbi:hypothetical protein BH10CYA1_BH10CYA1_03510 [soil metagenome]
MNDSMKHRWLLLLLGLIVTAPAPGQQTNQNKIIPGSVPANIYDAVPQARERQIIEERPVIRDFRTAPEAPEAINAPKEKTGGTDLNRGTERIDVQSAKELLSAKKYIEAEHVYRELLKIKKSAENYAGLAESLAMQNKITDAEVVLREARATNFGDDANIAAVGGHVCYLHANAISYTKYGLYLEASLNLCKRALAMDPNNQIALDTLKKIRLKRLEKAKEFEKNGDLVLAQFEYQELLLERSDDAEASLGLGKILKLRGERGEDVDVISASKRHGMNAIKLMKSMSDGFVREIPAQTKVLVIFDSPLNSDTSKVGDKFSARTLEPIAEKDGYVVLPVGAVIKGTVTRASEWTSDAHFTANGKVQLLFDSIEAPGIAPIPLVAEFVSDGGVIGSIREGQNISINTATFPRPPFTWLLAKQGRIVDVRAGDKFRLVFPDGLRVPQLPRQN